MPNVVFITSRAVALDGIEYTYSVYQTAKSGTSGIPGLAIFFMRRQLSA